MKIRIAAVLMLVFFASDICVAYGASNKDIYREYVTREYAIRMPIEDQINTLITQKTNKEITESQFETKAASLYEQQKRETESMVSNLISKHGISKEKLIEIRKDCCGMLDEQEKAVYEDIRKEIPEAMTFNFSAKKADFDKCDRIFNRIGKQYGLSYAVVKNIYSRGSAQELTEFMMKEWEKQNQERIQK